MANEEHLDIIQKGVKVWNRWRAENPRIKPDLKEADLSGMDFTDADFSYADLGGADLSDANLLSVNLHKSNLKEANLYDVNLSGADLSDADLNNSDLSGGNLSDANLSRAILSKAYINRANLFEAYLCEAHLNESEFVGTDFIGTNISRANLSEANFYDALFSTADLSDTNLSDANLCKADLFDTNLCNADLSGANLVMANLKNTNLNRANFQKVHIGWTVFARVDMSEIDGLADVIHRGPSTIGTDTVQKSGGRIPSLFLRRCGMSPWEIESARLYDLALSPVEVKDILNNNVLSSRTEESFFSKGIFVSCSIADFRFAQKLHKHLEKAGASVWIDSHDLSIGSPYGGIVKKARINDVIIMVLSESSVVSDWIESELEIGSMKDKRHGRSLVIPVSLDDSWQQMTDKKVIWRQLRRKTILDFSDWKTQNFATRFEELLETLLTKR